MPRIHEYCHIRGCGKITLNITKAGAISKSDTSHYAVLYQNTTAASATNNTQTSICPMDHPTAPNDNYMHASAMKRRGRNVQYMAEMAEIAVV